MMFDDLGDSKGNARRFVLASSVLLALLTVVGCESKPPVPAANAKTGVVIMEFQGTTEPQDEIRFENVAEGTSLESLMRDIPGINVAVKGSGTTAFVDVIGETSTSASEGWTFKIDGEWSDKGVGTTELHPPTTVTWSYGAWDGGGE